MITTTRELFFFQHQTAELVRMLSRSRVLIWRDSRPQLQPLLWRHPPPLPPPNQPLQLRSLPHWPQQGLPTSLQQLNLKVQVLFQKSRNLLSDRMYHVSLWRFTFSFIRKEVLVGWKLYFIKSIKSKKKIKATFSGFYFDSGSDYHGRHTCSGCIDRYRVSLHLPLEKVSHESSFPLECTV